MAEAFDKSTLSTFPSLFEICKHFNDALRKLKTISRVYIYIHLNLGMKTAQGLMGRLPEVQVALVNVSMRSGFFYQGIPKHGRYRQVVAKSGLTVQIRF